MTWILPEGTKNPRYDKLDPVTKEYFDFAYNEKTGEGYRYNEDTREFILYIRDNGRYDQDDTLGKVRDPGIIRDENVLPKIVSAARWSTGCSLMVQTLSPKRDSMTLMSASLPLSQKLRIVSF